MADIYTAINRAISLFAAKQVALEQAWWPAAGTSSAKSAILDAISGGIGMVLALGGGAGAGVAVVSGVLAGAVATGINIYKDLTSTDQGEANIENLAKLET
jgi:hypothetical protein